MRPLHVVLRSALCACLWPVALAAQSPDSTATTVRVPISDSAVRLPADRASELIPWATGGGLDETSAPAWHGLPLAKGAWVIDGVRWASALRSTGYNNNSARPVRLEPGLNALDDARIGATALSPVTLALTTRGGGDRWTLRGSGETGAPLRPDGGTGDTRFEIAGGGPIAGAFRLGVGATLTGREAASGGVGYDRAPYYLATGIDTVLQWQDASFDSIEAPVQHYTASDKVPLTPRTTEDWTARLDGSIGGIATWAHWIGSRSSEGLLHYLDLYNPAQSKGIDQQGYDLAAGMIAPLGPRRLAVTLAVQHERSEEGPLTNAAELDARAPGLGILLGGLDLRWDMGNFPIDDQLVTNYRDNIPGSRRSPYDLENPDQYRLNDQYRNSPYATYGWSEDGGPVGQLKFYDDRRLLGSAELAEDRVLGGTARLGIEVVRHDARNYAMALTSEAFSNVWIEHPDEMAATLGWIHREDRWSLDAGVRVDRFASGGRRPYDLVTDPADPRYGTYVWFPRGASVAATDPNNVHWVEDKAHTAAAPHVTLQGALGPGWRAHAGFQRSAQIPDLADLYDGINTDLAITNTNASYGRDLGHEIVDHWEAGVAWDTGGVHLEGGYFEDHYEQVVTTRLTPLYDPLKKQNSTLLVHQMTSAPAIRGATLSARSRLSGTLALGGAYTYLATDDKIYFTPSFALYGESPLRHHNFAATAQLTGPALGPAAGFGALVTLRVMSGLAQGTDSLGANTSLRSDHVPAWKSLDLRVGRTVTFAGRRATAYLDARNLLNVANLLHAFPIGDPRSDPTRQEQAWQMDSASYATEAAKNGRYSGAGTIDLTFGGAGRAGCGAWQASSGEADPPDCAYLIAAEERFGNGDGLYTVSEQRAASNAYYLTRFGPGAFSGPPRAIRIGLEIGF